MVTLLRIEKQQPAAQQLVRNISVDVQPLGLIMERCKYVNQTIYPSEDWEFTLSTEYEHNILLLTRRKTTFPYN